VKRPFVLLLQSRIYKHHVERTVKTVSKGVEDNNNKFVRVLVSVISVYHSDSEVSKGCTKDLGLDAVFPITGTLVASGASINCAPTLHASYVPYTLDSGAIQPFASRGTTAARFKFMSSIKALVIASKTARGSNGACSETLGTEL